MSSARHSPSPPVTIVCDQCDREFLRYPSEIRKARSTTRYCSRSCHHAARAAIPPIMGVYVIAHIPSARWYVGGSTNITSRWAYHRSALRRGVHENAVLQALWTKDGESAFYFRVAEVVEDAGVLREREQAKIDSLQSFNPQYGLNIHPVAGSSAGYSPTPETRAKISAAGRGRKHTPETRAKISAAHMGKAGGRPTFGLERRSLTTARAMEIKCRLADGVSSAQVAEETGVPSYTIGRIARGIIYADVLPELNAIIAANRPEWRRGNKSRIAKLTPDAVRAIRSRLEAGETATSIAKDFGITRGMVGHIKRCLAWNWLL